MSNLTKAKSAIARLTPPKGLSLTIVIEGESAEELLAVGPHDIADHFLGKAFGASYRSSDVKSIKFTAPEDVSVTRKVKRPAHRDNF